MPWSPNGGSGTRSSADSKRLAPPAATRSGFVQHLDVALHSGSCGYGVSGASFSVAAVHQSAFGCPLERGCECQHTYPGKQPANDAAHAITLGLTVTANIVCTT
jgi:hypothetical protein